MKVKRKALWERQLLAAVIYFLEFHVARDAWVLGRKLGKMVCWLHPNRNYTSTSNYETFSQCVNSLYMNLTNKHNHLAEPYDKDVISLICPSALMFYHWTLATLSTCIFSKRFVYISFKSIFFELTEQRTYTVCSVGIKNHLRFRRARLWSRSNKLVQEPSSFIIHFKRNYIFIYLLLTIYHAEAPLYICT